MDNLILYVVVGIVALAFAGYLANKVIKEPVGTDRMKEISSYIHEGAMAFLTREYKTLIIFIVVLFFGRRLFFNSRRIFRYAGCN